MKRAFSLLAVFLMMLAAGCEKQNESATSSTEIPNAFTANAEISFRDIYMTARITKSAENELKIKMLTPEALAPLEISCKNGACTAAYDGISFSVETNRFPQTEFALIASQALEYADANVELKKSVSDGKISYQGSTDSGVFVLTQDEKSGALLDLSVEGAQLHIVFKDFKKT